MLNILRLVSGNSETCKRNNYVYWVTEVLCNYMQLKILLQFRNFMINFIQILLKFGSFENKFHENSVKFYNIKKNVRNFSTFFAILRYIYQKTS